MKQLIFMAALLGFFLTACGTKKDENIVYASLDQAPIAADLIEAEQPGSACGLAGQVCPEPLNLTDQQLTLSKVQSWLNPFFDPKGAEHNAGSCLDTALAGTTDSQGQAVLDLNLKNMKLQPNRIGFGTSSHCRVELQVIYKQGWAFAIKKVALPLVNDIKPDASAFLKGSYGIKDQNPIAIRKDFDSSHDDRPLRIEYTVPDHDIVWSSCSGQSTVVIDTKIGMNFIDLPTTEAELLIAEENKNTQGLDHGSMKLDGRPPTGSTSSGPDANSLGCACRVQEMVSDDPAIVAFFFVYKAVGKLSIFQSRTAESYRFVRIDNRDFNDLSLARALQYPSVSSLPVAELYMLLKAASTSMIRVFALTLVFSAAGGIFLAKQDIDQREQFAKELRTVSVVPPASKPAMTQESIDIAVELFDIRIPDTAAHPHLDLSLEDRGLTTLSGWGTKLEVTIGPAAFSSWALLGSTLAHELEIHCNQNFAVIRMKDMMGLEGTEQAEREAYMHELANSERFHLKTADQLNIKATMDYYYPAAAQKDDRLSARR